jgi:hypothetical protein
LAKVEMKSRMREIRKSGSGRGGEVPKLEFQRPRLPIADKLAAQGNRKRKRKNHKRLLDIVVVVAIVIDSRLDYGSDNENPTTLFSPGHEV